MDTDINRAPAGRFGFGADHSQRRRRCNSLGICDPADGVAWEERHAVRGADGSIATFQNSGLSQLVFDDQGQLVSHAVWTPDGPEMQPIVQPAFAPMVAPLVVEGGIATIRLALTLFTWLSTRNAFNRQAILGFTARDYRSVGPAGLTLGYVGMLDRDQVEAVCPRLEEVQERANAAAKTVTDSGLGLGPAEYGTAVHSNLKKQIDALNDPDFRAEISFLKSEEAKYGAKDSIRMDVLEMSVTARFACTTSRQAAVD